MRFVKALFFAVVLCVLTSASVRAQTVNAASCNSSDVQTALNSVSQSSATVNIPAGTCTWSSALQWTVPAGTTSIVIQGAGAVSATSGGASTTGTDQTILTDNSSSEMFHITTASNQSVRVTAIAFEQNSSSPSQSSGMLHIDGYSTAVRVDHCHFYGYIGGINLRLEGAVLGVADHDYFSNSNTTQLFNIEFRNGEDWNGQTDGMGNGTWADSDYWGTSKFFYVEDSQFNLGTFVTDSSAGARYVVRYSTMTDVYFANHSTNAGGGESSADRGFRAVELYGNNFTMPSGSGTFFSWNSGSILAWGNTGGDVYGLLSTQIIRLNNLTYPETFPPDGFGYCGEYDAQSNGVTEDSPWDGNNNATYGYPCLDQPGRGKGDLVNGNTFPNILNSTTSTATWTHEALDPGYVWDNSVSPLYTGYVVDSNIPSGGNVLDNRDYYQQFGTGGESGSNCTTSPCNITKGVNQTSRAPVNGTDSCTAGTDPMTGGSAPGVGWWNTANDTLYVCNPTNTWTSYYTPYTYPHPLTQGGTTTINAPTSLTATVN